MCFASRSRQVPDSTRFASWSRQVTDSMAETSVADTCFGPLNAGGAAAPATLRSAAQLGRRGAASTRQRPTRQTAIHSPDSPGEQIARRRFTSPIYSVSKSPDSDSLTRQRFARPAPARGRTSWPPVPIGSQALFSSGSP